MCGIIGMASVTTLIDRDRKFFKQALLCDQVRGLDSTGVFAVPKDPKAGPEIFKKSYAAGDFLQMNRANCILNAIGKYSLFVGHNRAATKGAINHINAHPFQYGDITLVHNGTLRTYNGLPGYNKAEVDSRILTKAINSIGIQESVNKIVSGAYALVWHDASDNSLNFLRNSERPLAIGTTKISKELYFASEIKMLDWLTDRNKIPVSDIIELQENMHVKLDLSAQEFDPEIREVKRKATVTVSRNKYQAPFKPLPKTEKPATSNVVDIESIKTSKYAKLPEAGDIVEAYLCKFRAYKGTSVGAIEGLTSEKPLTPVEIHNCAEEEFVEGLYRFRVVNVVWSDLSKDYIIRGIGHGLVEEAKECPKKSEDSSKSSTCGKEDLREKESQNKSDTKTTSHGKGAWHKVETSIKDTLAGLLPDQFDCDRDTGEVLNVTGPHGSMVSETEYHKLTRHGCSNCQSDLYLEDAEFLTWQDWVTPICSACEAEREYDPVAEGFKKGKVH